MTKVVQLGYLNFEFPYVSQCMPNYDSIQNYSVATEQYHQDFGTRVCVKNRGGLNSAGELNARMQRRTRRPGCGVGCKDNGVRWFAPTGTIGGGTMGRTGSPAPRPRGPSSGAGAAAPLEPAAGVALLRERFPRFTRFPNSLWSLLVGGSVAGTLEVVPGSNIPLCPAVTTGGGAGGEPRRTLRTRPAQTRHLFRFVKRFYGKQTFYAHLF